MSFSITVVFLLFMMQPRALCVSHMFVDVVFIVVCLSWSNIRSVEKEKKRLKSRLERARKRERKKWNLATLVIATVLLYYCCCRWWCWWIFSLWGFCFISNFYSFPQVYFSSLFLFLFLLWLLIILYKCANFYFFL